MSLHIPHALVLLISVFSLAACSHEAENTGTMAMVPHYQLQAQKGAEAVTTPGHVSRYQRQAIVAGGPDVPMSPMAQNFDGIMDHLETLMKPQIDENNRIAAAQAASPSFKF